MPLEKAIANLKYVFSKDSLSRGVSPPPNPISPKILSPTLYSYFERAFLESGISSARPTGAEWVAALDEFRVNLQNVELKQYINFTGDFLIALGVS